MSDGSRMARGAAWSALGLSVLVATTAYASDLTIDSCRADKLLYRPGETGTLSVVIANGGRKRATTRVVVNLVRELDDRTELPTKSIEIPAGQRESVTFGFTASGRFGVEAQVRARAGGASATASDYFCVADDFFEVGIGSTWGSDLHTGLGKQREVPGNARRIYSNWLELFFWAPCDWSQLVSPLDRWWSGQAGYPENEKNLLELVRECQRLGIRVAAYASCNPAGPFAWEVARRRPEMFRRNAYGAFDGYYDVEHLDFWNDPAWRAKPRQTAWYRLNLDLRRLETVDWGIDQIIASTKHYGWDAIRFDGHYAVYGHDEISARNMRRLKERVSREAPHLRLGFNFGRAPEWKGGVTHEMREAMAGGGLYLQEGIRNWRYTEEAYESWSRYSQNELRVGKQVQALGGSYHCILGTDDLPPAPAFYKFVYSLIAGGHPFYGEHANIVGCSNWGAFLTRWSAMLWDRRLARLDDAAQHFSVEGSSRVEWESLVQERIESTQRKFVVLHLVNPSTSDQISETRFPEPLESLRVAYRPRAGEQVKRATLVSPDQDVFDLPLVLERDGDQICVSVPAIERWGMLVWELKGEYEPPADVAPFTEPADAAQVAQAMRDAPAAASPDPNQRTAQARANAEIWETNTGFTGHGIKTIVSEADAYDGLAQRRDVEQPTSSYPFLGRPYIGPLPAGRYRVGVRLKRTTAEVYAPGRVRFRVHDHRTDKELAVAYIQTKGHPGPPAAPPCLTFANSGVYAVYSLEIELRQAGMIQISVWPEGDQAPCSLHLDHIEIETLLAFRDSTLAEWNPVAKPGGLPTPKGARPARGLVVAGMFWQQYHSVGAGLETRYDLPATYQELYRYDLIVLCNVDARRTSYECRKALLDWVNDGGRLVVLGGVSTLGQGGMMATYFEDLLPFQMRGSGEVIKCEPPLVLGDRPNQPFADAPQLFWRHEVKVDPDSQVLAFAGGVPIIARRDVGRGQVFAFAGTVLGESDRAHRPFWETASWQGLWKQICGLDDTRR
jgi:hypothetical protein